MNEFVWYNPVKILFGKDAVEKMRPELEKVGKNILLTYGGGSIKKNGIYDRVCEVLCSLGKNVHELSGIMPNPRKEVVYAGIDICKKNDIDFILAVGGGSVIDASKAIAAGALTDLDFWDAFYMGDEELKAALPIGTVLTLPATGSEMNIGSVVTDWQNNIKTAFEHPLLFPVFSVMDPTYTYSLPREQIVYGAVDMLSHLFEVYFSEPNDNNLSDDLSEAVMKNIMTNLDIALVDPYNYEARANLMWDGTMALNGITKLSKRQDWETHQIEHAMSAFFDIPHGAGLAVVHPNYMRYTYKHGLKKYVRYAKNIWNVDTESKTDDEIALEGIRATHDYFKKIGAPVTLAEVGIDVSDADKIVSRTFLLDGGYLKCTEEDIKNIVLLCDEQW
ncbi:MAG: iron-containing alcohol dehydrogenase [Clostridia bacterium]|nr:iron-containing alcohol dehydrogenase [Clostridia bacterium]